MRAAPHMRNPFKTKGIWSKRNETNIMCFTKSCTPERTYVYYYSYCITITRLGTCLYTGDWRTLNYFKLYTLQIIIRKFTIHKI